VTTPTRPDSISPASDDPAGIRPEAPPPEARPAPGMPAAPAVAMVGRHWGLPVLLGALSVVAGLAMLAWPAETVLVIAVVIGIQLLVNGVVRLVQSFAADDGSGGERTLVALLGIFSILVGVLCLRNILQTVTVLAVLVGVFWLVGGIIEVIGGLSTGSVPGRGWRLLSGALGVIAGIAVLAYPGISLGALVVLFGIYLLLFGVISIVTGLAVRRAAHRAGVA
jgi:uncharacterized membrane protein HdeD (DUF308 family)